MDIENNTTDSHTQGALISKLETLFQNQKGN